MAFQSRTYGRSVAIWLGFMCLLVIAMIILGGATRLTNSGLSITEWKPITGALPPLSHEAWISEFEKYKLIPEFEAEHPDMTLKDFEFIYFWEWSHRQLGRFIGLAFLLPFFYFLWKLKIPPGRTKGFWLAGVLIGAQGAIGWWMVASGLTDDRVSVSQYRLATHLGMAFIILGLFFWMFLDAIKRWPVKVSQHGYKRSTALMLVVWLQVIAGAFVAGLGAGRVSQDWPDMGGTFVPYNYYVAEQGYLNFFENAVNVHFNHRILAYILLAGTIAALFTLSKRKNSRTKGAVWLLLLAIVWQAGLGIATVVNAVPLWMALLHQASAIGVFLIAVWMVWTARLTR
ncbi:COX15/CtaA family protein [Robiginitomaculum antarcticum]|uniref:COX15/CtaA family protein n=1 Tax=Robiginitomaculum antarcticum TaxID=437507 RepID=UPI00036CE6AB|nr:COX15/CtaA family protein [Robiginitomaculum antarcticum]